MNARIQELALKAGFENAYANLEDGFEVVFTNEAHTTKCLKKFAELMVKECTNIVLHYTDVDEGVAVAKKQFGVK